MRRPQGQKTRPRNVYVRLVLGLVLGLPLAREPRRAARRAASSSNIHFGMRGSWAGWGDQTHLRGSLTLPPLERMARRLNTWYPVYFGLRRMSPTLLLAQAPRARALLGGTGGGYLAGSALSRSAMRSSP